jgi:uncharacterized protein (TIGR03083 family)
MRAPSYDSEWTVAQVFSHLGSGAEVFGLFLDAGTGRAAEPPARAAFGPIWDRWNALTPEDQVAEAVTANEGLTSRIEALEPAEQAAIRLDFFGNEMDAAGFMRARLGEHAVHTWDIAVVGHRDGAVAADAVALLIDGLSGLVARTGKADEGPFVVQVTTTDPARTFELSIGDGAELRSEPSADGSPTGSISLSAEAFLRLVYGRLDADHTPAGIVIEGPVDLDHLRRTFPGF